MKQVKKNYEFEYRVMSRPTAFSGITRSSRFHCMEEKDQCLFNNSNGSGKFSVETLKDEIKSLVLHNKEFKKSIPNEF